MHSWMLLKIIKVVVVSIAWHSHDLGFSFVVMVFMPGE